MIFQNKDLCCFLGRICTNVDPNLSRINVTSRLNICKMVKKI